MNSGISPYCDQVLGHHAAGTAPAVSRFFLERRSAPKPIEFLPIRRSMMLVEVGERAAADEQDVGGVDREELLVGVLAPALRRHVGDRALEDLQQRLLDALARHVARDRRVVGLARDLVDLVDVDDPGLGLLDVEVGGLDQLQQDVLDVLADVPGLGQRGRVGDRERHVQDPRQRLCQQRLAAAGRAQQQDVRLGQLHLGVALAGHLHALVVVVDGHRQRALGLFLADHVLVQHVADLARPGQVVEVELAGVVSSSSMISLQRSMHSSQM